MEVAFLPGQDEDNDVDDGNEVVEMMVVLTLLAVMVEIMVL